MQAIQVKCLPPTSTKGSRVKAFCHAGSVTIGLHSTESERQTHRLAAETLAAKLGWVGKAYGKLISATLPNGDKVFVSSVED